jgi:hypothetical protein
MSQPTARHAIVQACGGTTRLLLLLVLLVAVRTRPVQAQATRADSAAVLLDAAARFERDGRPEVANAIYRMLRDRFGDTSAAAEAGRMLAQQPGDRSTRSGRVELQVWTTLYGLWLGVAVPAALGADESEPYGVGLLVGGPVGFLTGLGLARSRELSDGQARAITFGGTWGTWQGYGWSDVLDLGENDYSCDGDLCINDGSSEERFAGMIAGGLAGIAAGILVSKKPISPATATTVNFGALWGTWFGVAGGIIADQEGDGLLATTLLAGDAGLLVTALLEPRWNLSRNRARLISISGVMGGLAGAGIDLLVQPDNEKVGLAIPLAGSIAGLTIGAISTRNFDARVGGGPGGDDAGSLLRLEDGRIRPGTPVPMLTIERLRIDGQRRWEPRARLMLFNGRF